MRLSNVTLPLVACVTLGVTSCAIAIDRKHDPFPKNPTMQEMKNRVPDWKKFINLGRCEQPGDEKYGVAWSNQGPTYGGGLGIYKGTWYAAGTPYRLWSGSISETILVADAIRDRFGITAWGAWRCFG